ncbi:MAG: pentapeptide repeat-containing protein [Tildeniella nuda ZEHNDER 1965/U140]|nr:pentapeptide repeat-containing protein [Tildeniella nuda ZEHNDER 1965/U140]
MLTKLWAFLNTDIQDLNWKQAGEMTKTGTDAAKAVFDLAKTVKEQQPKVETLKPYIGQISSLLDVLNAPFAQIVKDTIPFAPLAITVLKLVCDVTHQEPSLEQCVALVSQVAYLESLQVILKETPDLLDRLGEAPVSDAIAQQIKRLGDLEIDDRDARKAILYFHESKLATAFNEVLQARLQQAGLEANEAQTLTDRVARKTDEYMPPALAQVGDGVKRLVEWYRLGGREVLEKYLSIDDYLTQQIQTRPLEKVFAEHFTFRDIYVPLKAQFIQRDGDVDKDKEPVELEQWAKDLLNDDQKRDRVMFIQGGPGRGKSVFCRMFADWVRQHEHPRWTPILIRLRDIRTLEKDFEETLRKAVDRDFARNDPGWLTDRNIRFLFLLDGFDELLMEGRTSGGLEEFLKQVGRFQESCKDNAEKEHRVLITGRSLSLQSIERLMPANLERVELLPMDDALQERWFTQWGKLINADPVHLKTVLQDEQLPDRVRELAREPLLLYLLAAMHRDSEFKLEMFEGTAGVKARDAIYNRTIDWVLTKQRPEWLNQDITALQTESLRRILAEAGLCVVQSGGECAPVKMIEDRLKGDDEAKRLLEEARSRLQGDPLRNALAAFYLQPGRAGSGSVEFAHKSFGEFLCAGRIKDSLADWAQPGIRRQEFYIPTEQMDWEIYDLLGFGGLTPEIVEYITAYFDICSDLFDAEKIVRLFKRLEHFYVRWCDGEFIDAPPENLPQKKMRLLKEQLPDREKPLGQRQVDVYTGLNVMILLLELNRYAQDRNDLKEQIIFYPNGQVSEGEITSRLLQVIHYSDCLGHATFTDLAGSFLACANLTSADLPDINLELANLTGTNLTGANLASANLTGTNLTGANLISAHLACANLMSAYLAHANLAHASLYSAPLAYATLSHANLASANLGEADLGYANLQDIFWDKNTNWEGVQGLETAVNVPEALKRQLGMEEEVRGEE